MRYYYSTVGDIIMTHSEVLNHGYYEEIQVHFERPSKEGKGFDFLDLTLPGGNVYKTFGYSEDEILGLQRYAKNNEPLIWEFARSGGGENA